MNWIGAIPVHKPEDHNSPTSNDEMFASCYGALDDAGNILIFPEGVTRNEPSIATVKTGAARIAIGARHMAWRAFRSFRSASTTKTRPRCAAESSSTSGCRSTSMS